MTHLVREHSIEIALPIDVAFPLFTPRGEMDWIAEWRPEFIHPADGTTEEGMVFRTGTGEEATIWSCIEWAPEAHRVCYARVTPASRFVHVEVRCAASGPERALVHVTYRMTALSAAGEAILASMTPEVFQATIEGWKTMIGNWIEQRR